MAIIITPSNQGNVKRPGGKIAKNGKWLVITESTGNPDTGYVHNCGTQVFAATVEHRVLESGQKWYGIVPYCPVCEEKPKRKGGVVRARDIHREEG